MVWKGDGEIASLLGPRVSLVYLLQQTDSHLLHKYMVKQYARPLAVLVDASFKFE